MVTEAGHFCFDAGMDALSEEEIEQALAALPEWEYDGEAVTKTFTWASFRDAIDFVNDVADLAEDENHHPDLEIYFDEVIVSFRTHSADSVTDRDVEMAAEVEDLLADDELDDDDDDELDDDDDDDDGDDDLIELDEEEFEEIDDGDDNDDELPEEL